MDTNTKNTRRKAPSNNFTPTANEYGKLPPQAVELE